MSTISGIFWAVANIAHDLTWKLCPPARGWLERRDWGF